jgi:hypothetical protein
MAEDWPRVKSPSDQARTTVDGDHPARGRVRAGVLYLPCGQPAGYIGIVAVLPDGRLSIVRQ